MSELPVQRVEQKKDWAISAGAFNALLRWLDEGAAESEGRKYLEMRRRLVAYFDRKNCLAPDDLADETLNRVARRLEEEGSIESESPAKYCYIVARFVFMEQLRGTRNEGALIEELRRRPHAGAERDDVETEVQEKRLDCLERCAEKLEPRSRELITRYYAGKERVKIENRRALAAALGITANALGIRVCRLRDRLEECVRRCVEGAEVK